MPMLPPHPCSYPGCNALVYGTAARCDKHAKTYNWTDDKQRGSRHKRGYGSWWVKIRQRVLARDKYLCQVCLADGRITPAQAVDHIKPKAMGGTDALDNLQAICNQCHASKTAREGGG